MPHALPSTNREHVVVIGAGFGGLNVVQGLADASVDVTLVDQNNFHTFLPLLYQVATSGLNSADVAPVVRGILQKQANASFRQGTVVGIDWDARSIQIAGQESLAFDRVVVAAGSAANFFGIPGAAEHAIPLYALSDAVTLRNRVLRRFEAADRAARLDDGELTFVIVGGGPTGVETAGAMAELFDKVLRRDFRGLDVSLARVVLVEAGPTLLAPFSSASQRHALDALRARGVDVRLGAGVDAVDAFSVTLDDGSRILTRTLIWAGGVRANPLTDVLDVPLGRGGRIVVDDRLQIEGRQHAYAIGDAADIADGAGGALPQLAPVAIQSGEHVARRIAAEIASTSIPPFRYRDKGTMATIGRRSAVAELPNGVALSGSLAWGAWLALHLYFLIGFRNRVSVLVNWAWNYLTWDRGPRLIFGPERDDDG